MAHSVAMSCGAATHAALQAPRVLRLGSKSLSSALPCTLWKRLTSSCSIQAVSHRHLHLPVRASAADAVESEAAVADEATTESAEESGRVKTKALTKQVKHIMNVLNHEAAQALHKERNIPDFRPGDVLALRVEVPENKRRVSLIRGIVIARRNGGINTTFRIRRILAGVGVEMVFPLYSPNIKEIKVVDRRKARRAKLYYLRDKIARLSTVN